MRARKVIGIALSLTMMGLWQIGCGGSGGGGVGVCAPGDTIDCYTGAEGTDGIGACVGGTATCTDDGTGFGPCVGEVVPATRENCATPGDDDCDGMASPADPDCECDPGDVTDCYSGPAGTEGVGICLGGSMTCTAEGSYGPCDGEVTPELETCATAEDDDCDGQVNEDGDGCQCVPGSTVSCYSGPAGTDGVGLCTSGFEVCNDMGTGYEPCAGEVVPVVETCNTPGDDDCDGEVNEDGAGCVCIPGSTAPCYNGPAGTEGVGICLGGTMICNTDGTAYGLCVGEVLPTVEQCATGIDEDCSGVADDVPDIDGDGWTACDGDCCEVSTQCSDPPMVNPGAFEFIGNSVDDDCDPATSDTAIPPPCSTAEDFTVTPNNMAEAMDLCQFTTANEPLATRKWGVIDASFRTPAGAVPAAAQLNSMQNSQAAVLVNYGNVIVPEFGPTMAGISSGVMRDQGDPGYAGTASTMGYYQQPPASYLAAHGGSLPSSASCMGSCPSGSGANDGVNLRLELRVPTNALSLSYAFRFFSYEYWVYACSSYNDFYLALLQTGAAGIPADGNISFDSQNNPVSVNNGFFDVCTAHNCYTCPAGPGDLAGTGMDVNNYGGGTVWLTTTAPVIPGETIVLELMIFDVSDGTLDSLSLLDNFQWDINPSGVGTEPTD